jgi:hypothetical protein
MTKKDYIRAAALIKASGGDRNVTEAFVAFFKGDNPRFDIERFLEAAGMLPFAVIVPKRR